MNTSIYTGDLMRISCYIFSIALWLKYVVPQHFLA